MNEFTVAMFNPVSRDMYGKRSKNLPFRNADIRLFKTLNFYDYHLISTPTNAHI